MKSPNIRGRSDEWLTSAYLLMGFIAAIVFGFAWERTQTSDWIEAVQLSIGGTLAGLIVTCLLGYGLGGWVVHKLSGAPRHRTGRLCGIGVWVISFVMLSVRGAYRGRLLGPGYVSMLWPAFLGVMVMECIIRTRRKVTKPMGLPHEPNNHQEPPKAIEAQKQRKPPAQEPKP